MRGRKSGTAVRTAALFYFLLAVFVQFAPSLHALVPHDAESSTCNHDPNTIHFEAAAKKDDSPCAICAHFVGRQVLLLSVGLRFDDSDSVRSTLPPPPVPVDHSVLHLPCPRGPPSAL